MSNKKWWMLAAAGAAGAVGLSIYKSSQQSKLLLHKARRNFEKGKAELIDSPERINSLNAALESLQQILDKYPNSHYVEETLRMKGIILGWLGQEEDAIKTLEESISKFPQSAGTETGIYLAQAYQRNGEYQKALDLANRFLEISGDSLPPESWPLKNALAIKAATARELGKTSEAEEASRELENLSLQI